MGAAVSPVSDAALAFLCSIPAPCVVRGTDAGPTSAAPVVAMAESGLEVVDALLGVFACPRGRVPNPDLSAAALTACCLFFSSGLGFAETGFPDLSRDIPRPENGVSLLLKVVRLCTGAPLVLPGADFFGMVVRTAEFLEKSPWPPVTGVLVPLALPVLGRGVGVAEERGFSFSEFVSGGAVGGRRAWFEPETGFWEFMEDPC